MRVERGHLLARLALLQIELLDVLSYFDEAVLILRQDLAHVLVFLLESGALAL